MSEAAPGSLKRNTPYSLTSIIAAWLSVFKNNLSHSDMLWQKLEYAHANPLHRVYVDDPVHRRYSSARNHTGMHGLLDVIANWA